MNFTETPEVAGVGKTLSSFFVIQVRQGHRMGLQTGCGDKPGGLWIITSGKAHSGIIGLKT